MDIICLSSPLYISVAICLPLSVIKKLQKQKIQKVFSACLQLKIRGVLCKFCWQIGIQQPSLLTVASHQSDTRYPKIEERMLEIKCLQNSTFSLPFTQSCCFLSSSLFLLFVKHYDDSCSVAFLSSQINFFLIPAFSEFFLLCSCS